MRFCYQSQDALYESHIINDDIYLYDKNIRKSKIDNIFKRYLFFKNKSKLMKMLSQKIVNIFRKIDFVIN